MLDSVVSSGLEGAFAYTTIGGGAARIFVTRCTIQNTTYALDSETLSGAGTALVAVSSSVITNNDYA